MTREHAAVQLLKHGPLDSSQFRKITGWTLSSCEQTLGRVRKKGLVKLIQKGSAKNRFSIYEAV